MFSILFLGLIISIVIGIIYLAIAKKMNVKKSGLPWKVCFLFGFLIYIISLFLGSISTIIFEILYEQRNYHFDLSIIPDSFGLMMYAMIFTFFIVLPALIIGLKSISKTNLSKLRKELVFASVSLVLVVIVNLIMTGFILNLSFARFLSGFSFFGILTPWAFVKLKNVFKAE
jgi:hypothetical protein